MSRKIGYAASKEYNAICDLLPSNIGRATITDCLVKAFGVDTACELIHPRFASKEQLCRYHDQAYISYLLQDSEDANETEDGKSLEQRFGLEFDCPNFEGIDKYIQAVAGTTLACVRYLQGSTNIAVNWNGGRHHAGSDHASGFCYINDITSLINCRLRKSFDKVMYIDFDLHHGDGVEQAFAYSNRVLTASLHRFDRGFFPGTGNIKDIGKGKGRGYSFNIGLRPGLSDRSLKKIVSDILHPAFTQFQPNVLVIQCGADGLARDRMHEWNLTVQGYSLVVSDIVSTWASKIPVLLLGGGGYNSTDSARLWTSILARLTLGNDIMTGTVFKLSTKPDQ
ncbi:uncharacterized protein V1516DRAFT_700448 [Lipomyces oligophaga]|uniref:uncharacterized protein n=1 Tax=Lipomyces oligophaga TaxID=45792 RepID=UPI0034CFAD60